MGKLAFVFSGQGDQFAGMGKDLVEEHEEAKQVFRMCDRLRPGTSDQCFFCSEDELKETVNTQPCLFAVELAAAEVLKAHNVVPDVVAGFSLGEIAACAFAGVFPAEDGFRLISERGKLMQEATKKEETFMAAVLRLDRERVEAICASLGDLYAVNFNCPGQITVSGIREQLPALEEKVRMEGGRVILLNVGGGFHCPFMKTAAEGFKQELQQISLQEPDIEIYSNVTALPYEGDVEELLSRQIMSPVLWEDLIRNMIDSGVNTFIEIGPGKTLSGMIRRIDRTVMTYAVSDLTKILDEVKAC